MIAAIYNGLGIPRDEEHLARSVRLCTALFASGQITAPQPLLFACDVFGSTNMSWSEFLLLVKFVLRAVLDHHPI